MRPELDLEINGAASPEGYLRRLEEERRKIEGFRKELPLCMLILDEKIRQLEEIQRKLGEPLVLPKAEEPETDKKSWLSSARLWNPSRIALAQREEIGAEDRTGGGSEEEEREEAAPPPSLAAESDLSLFTPSFNLSHHAPRKPRRCWSPELHRRFIKALYHLGGAQAATPKQIRELMKVDGLTNDEVKSHLQKYRLHARKASSSSSSEKRPAWPPLEGLPRLKQITGSPQGPLNLGEDSGEEDDGRSEGHSWKGRRIHRINGDETD
ncbi:transcription factor HHO5-like isoform X2 [Wolffia australiana]